MITFDYNFDPGLHIDMVVICGGRSYAISMTDAPSGAIGRIRGIVADGKWHRASVDIYPLLRRHIRRGSLPVTAILFVDRNKADNSVGATARFDNFIIGRIGTEQIKVAWRATDATGIKGYSYVVDKSASTTPDTTIDTTSRVISIGQLSAGRWFVHVRAQDGAGNWGPPAHYAILHKTAQ